MTVMTWRGAAIVSLACAVLLSACGSNGEGMQTVAGCATPAATGCKVFVADTTSFVRWAGPATDAVSGGASTAVVRNTPGSFCMSGIVDPGPTGAGWGVLLHLGLSDVDETAEGPRVVAPFDASSHGIEQIQFTIENPPRSGVLPDVTQIRSLDCKTIPDCVLSFSTTTTLTSSGKVTLALTAFSQLDADAPNVTLDPTLLTGLGFSVAAPSATPTPYDFCIRGLAFLGPPGR